jgi:hypothetical protein
MHFHAAPTEFHNKMSISNIGNLNFWRVLTYMDFHQNGGKRDLRDLSLHDRDLRGKSLVSAMSWIHVHGIHLGKHLLHEVA